jgi:hypothetical protein
MEPLATLEELKNRLDWTLDDQEETVATSALEDASSLVRAYGLNWSPENVPPVIKSIVLASARRLMVNVQGLTVSRAGDETLGWSDIGDKAGSVYLTTDERQIIAGIARGSQTVTSVSTYAWGTEGRGHKIGASYVPVSYGGKPFPFFASEEDDW